MAERREKQAQQTEMSLEQPKRDSDVKAAENEGPVGEYMTWVTHPMKRKPVRATLVTVFILVCGGLVYYMTGWAWFAVLGVLILFGSLAKFYFPTRYTLDEEGVTVKTTTQTLKKPWSMYRSSYRDKNGVLLSPFVEPSRLENFRGLYLIFDNNGDDVTSFIARRLETPDDDSA